MFVTSLAEESKELETAFHGQTASRWEQIRKITHRLRGACCYCGVPQPHKCCEMLELETRLLDSDSPESCPDIMKCYHNLINAIQAVQLAYKEL